MTNWICSACFAEFPASDQPPAHCPICSDPRQFVPKSGQAWTSAADLIAKGYRTEIREHEPGLYGIGIAPQIDLGKRALLIADPDGGVLFDGVPLIDDAALVEIARLGGVRAIVASHPHLYGALVTNAKKLGNVPIYLPEADRDWLMHPDPLVRFFSERRLDLGKGVTLEVTGGHFEGSAFVHWAAGAEGRGALLTGDTIIPTPGGDWVSFMWSVPNMVPLGIGDVRSIAAAAAKYRYDRIYGGWWDARIERDARHCVEVSAKRLEAIASNAA